MRRQSNLLSYSKVRREAVAFSRPQGLHLFFGSNSATLLARFVKKYIKYHSLILFLPGGGQILFSVNIVRFDFGFYSALFVSKVGCESFIEKEGCWEPVGPWVGFGGPACEPGTLSSIAPCPPSLKLCVVRKGCLLWREENTRGERFSFETPRARWVNWDDVKG